MSSTTARRRAGGSPTLRLVTDSVKVHHVTWVKVSTKPHSVHRYRREKRHQEFWLGLESHWWTSPMPLRNVQVAGCDENSPVGATKASTFQRGNLDKTLLILRLTRVRGHRLDLVAEIFDSSTHRLGGRFFTTVQHIPMDPTSEGIVQRLAARLRPVRHHAHMESAADVADPGVELPCFDARTA